MTRFFTYIKEVIWIYVSMVVPLTLFLLYKFIEIYNKFSGTVRFGSESGELIEGFLIGIFYLVLPTALLYWLILRLLYRRPLFFNRRVNALLSFIAILTITFNLLIFNLTKLPEWTVIIVGFIGVLISYFILKQRDKPVEYKQ